MGGPRDDRPDDAGEDVPRPLEGAEARDVRADLDDLGAMRAIFAPQGVKGVVIDCPDCGEQHFYEWELLRENLEHLLTTGEPRMHEPAFEVREDEYIEWDYGRGYVDALAESGLAGEQRIAVDACPWCRAAPAPSEAAFCGTCGRSFAPLRIHRELLDRGMSDREVRELLLRAGVEPFAPSP
jgi:hypothetical protein